MSQADENPRKVRLGLAGAGMIATVHYGILPNFGPIKDRAEIVAVADPVVERARSVAADFGIPAWFPSLDEMLKGAELDAVVNLTPIPAHYETSLAILEAGKHLVTEKPISTTLKEADVLCDLAKSRKLVVVTAPPNMLFPDLALAKSLVRDGVIGKVAFARVRSSHGGAASYAWPADPSWFYQKGSGPLFDMGVYGIHEITGILGPAKRVVAYSGRTAPTRIVRGGPFAGKEIQVTADDNVLLMLDFGDSTFAFVDGTFNVLAAKSPHLELFGLGGTLNLYEPLPDDPPGMSLEVFRLDALPGLRGWIKPTYTERMFSPDRVESLGRAILIDHLVDCLSTGQAPVLSADHARHALEIMVKAQESAREGVVMELQTTFAN
ncbi:MAG: Gfo/Idh/MocA family oxidoreductase [Candidatus Limnocylindrales bacterium]